MLRRVVNFSVVMVEGTVSVMAERNWLADIHDMYRTGGTRDFIDTGRGKMTS